MNNKVFIKLMLINLLLFALLVLAFAFSVAPDEVLEAGTAFYSMEVGVLIGIKVTPEIQKRTKGKRKKKK